MKLKKDKTISITIKMTAKEFELLKENRWETVEYSLAATPPTVTFSTDEYDRKRHVDIIKTVEKLLETFRNYKK